MSDTHCDAALLKIISTERRFLIRLCKNLVFVDVMDMCVIVIVWVVFSSSDFCCLLRYDIGERQTMPLMKWADLSWSRGVKVNMITPVPLNYVVSCKRIRLQLLRCLVTMVVTRSVVMCSYHIYPASHQLAMKVASLLGLPRDLREHQDMCLNLVLFDHVRREFRTCPTITVYCVVENNNSNQVEICNPVMRKSDGLFVVHVVLVLLTAECS